MEDHRAIERGKEGHRKEGHRRAIGHCQQGGHRHFVISQRRSNWKENLDDVLSEGRSEHGEPGIAGWARRKRQSGDPDL